MMWIIWGFLGFLGIGFMASMHESSVRTGIQFRDWSDSKIWARIDYLEARGKFQVSDPEASGLHAELDRRRSKESRESTKAKWEKYL